MIKRFKILVVFALGASLACSCGGYFDECHFHLPKDFKKDITIHFGKEGYPKLVKGDDNNYHIQVDTSGQVYTSTEYSEYFDYQGEFFKWEGDSIEYSFRELQERNIIDSETSEGTSGPDGWVIYSKYIIFFVQEEDLSHPRP